MLFETWLLYTKQQIVSEKRDGRCLQRHSWFAPARKHLRNQGLLPRGQPAGPGPPSPWILQSLFSKLAVRECWPRAACLRLSSNPGPLLGPFPAPHAFVLRMDAATSPCTWPGSGRSRMCQLHLRQHQTSETFISTRLARWSRTTHTWVVWGFFSLLFRQLSFFFSPG